MNDRFALGSEEAVRIWSNRAAFADGWLLKADGESSEWLLMKWLERNRVKVEFLDLVFQRVRANGEVTAMDRGLGAAGNYASKEASLETRGPRAARERFVILAREAGTAAECLRKVLEPLGKVEVVEDREGEEESGGRKPPARVMALSKRHSIWMPDEETVGYEGLMGRLDVLPPVTAWSRAMVHLSRTLVDDEAVWFVEDDVAGDATSFAELVRTTREENPDLSAWHVRRRFEDPDWHFWTRADGFFDEPCCAFPPLCRVSGRLLREILGFREKHGRFIFHEVLFASLARARGMRLVDWATDCRTHFAIFRDWPETRPIERGISHPVKDGRVHEAVCRFGNVTTCERAAVYEGKTKRAWYQEDFGRWKRMFVTEPPLRILESGVTTGVSANLMLDELFTHPESEIHGIGLYDGEYGKQARQDFEENAERGGHAGQLHLYEGTSREVLAWMIAGEGFWESFDFIHLNGANDAAELLADSCQEWSLLRPGGILVFAGEDRERPAADAFLSVYGGRAEILFDGKRVAVMKHR